MLAPLMKREVKVLNRLGLHARPAAEFVRCARTFQSTVVIHKAGEVYRADSILDVLSASLECGCGMILEAEGTDAEAAIEKLALLLVEFQKQEG